MAMPQTDVTVAVVGGDTAQMEGRQMSRYFFNILTPNRTITDNTGTRLSGLEAAHWRAVGLAYQVWRHLPGDDGLWAIQIQDETRSTKEVFVPSFQAHAQARRQFRRHQSRERRADAF
jgi:hypothetical protein